MGQCESNAAAAALKGSGEVIIWGMSISGNVIPPVLFCRDQKCGDMKLMDIMKGENKTPEKLAINFAGQMPMMQDGSLNLAESNAILRYLAKVYAPNAYGATIEDQSNTDWIMDWCSTNFGESYKGIWYPVAGFGPKPDDQAATNKAALEKLEAFTKKFLPDGRKFLGGSTLSIADYKFGTLVWYLSHPAIEKHAGGYKNPPRIATYVSDWKGALSTESQKFLEDGWGFLDSKL